MAKAPAFQFYVRDWLTDTELGQCGPSTRGVWMDLLANMWVAPSQGKLAGSVESLARICRCTVAEMESAIDELEATGAAGVTRNGEVTLGHKKVTLVCRRMSRDAAERKSNADRQKRHRAKVADDSNDGSHKDVTTPSASAVSASASAVTHKKKPRSFDELLEDFPDLNSDAFLTAWEQWVQHRAENSKKLKATTIQGQVRKLAKVGHDAAVAMIENSIEQGYTGLFPPPIRSAQPTDNGDTYARALQHQEQNNGR